MQALRPLGIKHFAAWIAADPTDGDPRANIISNWPDTWMDAYLHEQRYLYDPIVTRALSEPSGFFWHELREPQSPQAQQLLKDAKALGMADGFTVSWRSPRPYATLLSMAGGVLTWTTVERELAAALADAFILRVSALRIEAADLAIQALSPQERTILHLSATGLTDRAIAQRLHIHRSTVLTHWSRIRAKLHASDRAQAVAIGMTSGQTVF